MTVFDVLTSVTALGFGFGVIVFSAYAFFGRLLTVAFEIIKGW